MNDAQIKAQIRKDKAAIKAAANRANRILLKYPDLQREFAKVIGKGKKQYQLGSMPWFQMPVESFSGVGSWGYRPSVGSYGESLLFADGTPMSGLGQDEKSWWESDFVSDLVDFGQSIVTHERIAADEQRQLELEIQQIQAKTKELEKQEALARALERSGTMTRAVGTTLRENPMAIPLLVGLGATLLFLQMRK